MTTRITAMTDEIRVPAGGLVSHQWTDDELANADGMILVGTVIVAGGLEPYIHTSTGVKAAEQQLQLDALTAEVLLNGSVRGRMTWEASNIIGVGIGSQNASIIARSESIGGVVFPLTKGNQIELKVTPALYWRSGGEGAINPRPIEFLGRFMLVKGSE